ncbi:unknown [[Clostridium] leptum CAG:27]|jgi:hypothetical protein|uniref:DUF8033 domain-containing protein n=1 Tax=[Clostridium] leptum CAG:27 TaxID=1263068 RepID=R6MZ87_9FIRM|nr:unknown [[Clostridium] leptum CAG:27]
MTREMQKAIKERKAEAALLVQYANPKSKSKPTIEQVLEVLKRHIPYCGPIRPVIEKFTVSEFNRNPIQRSAHFLVELDNGKQWDISVYESLKGRTPEEKEADKTATFPSGLFNIFHDEIQAPETELKQKEEEAGTMKRYKLTPTDGRKSFYGKAIVEIADDGTETLYSYDTPIIKRTNAGELVKLWDGWSATTGRHIAAFCGLNKAEYMSL